MRLSDSVQVRCLVDVPGEKLPSQVSGALSEYLTTHVANEVRQYCLPQARHA